MTPTDRCNAGSRFPSRPRFAALSSHVSGVVKMGQPRPVRAWSGAALALAVALASCTSADGSPAATITAAPSISPSTSSASTHPASAEPTAAEEVSSLWQALHTARLEQVYGDAEADGSAFAELATGEAAATLVDLVRLSRGELPTTMTGVEFWPDVDIAGNGTEATVADCILVATRPQAQPDDAETTVRSQVWTGTAERTGDRWRLARIEIHQDNCVSSELSRQVLESYGAWHEASNDWWDPPDPEHPLLHQRMVDPGLSDMRELLAEHRSMGIAIRDAHDLENAVVVDVGIGRARISDCFPASEAAAAYDLETGQRRADLSPHPSPGQVDHIIVDVQQTSNDGWKVEGWRSESGSDCTPGETPYVVAP